MTTTKRASLGALVLAGCLVASTSAAEAGSLRVRSIETEQRGEDRVVRIATSAKAKTSVFELADPFRILVDVSDATFASDLGELSVRDGVVRAVRSVGFEDAGRSTARVEIELREPRPYEVETNADGVTIHIRGARSEPTVQLGALEVSGTRDRAVLVAAARGRLSADAVRMEPISNPPRIVIDLAGTSIEPRYQRIPVGRAGVRRARVAGKPDGVRVVLDLAEDGELPEVTVDATDEQIRIVASPLPAAEPPAAARAADTKAEPTSAPAVEPPSTPEPAVVETSASPTVAAPAEPATSPAKTSREDDAPLLEPTAAADESTTVVSAARIKDIRFEPKDGFVRLTVVMDEAGFEVARAGEGNAPRLFLPNVSLPSRFERTLDVTEVSEGSVSAISSYNADGGVVLAAGIFDATEHRHWSKENRLMWDFRSAQGPRVQTHAAESTAAYRENMALALSRTAPSAKKYRGRRISLDLKDADIQNVLRLLADVSKLNIVAGDEVQGKVTIKLRNVPWDQALDIILSSRQLDKVRNGNIIRVAPIEVLRKEEELRLERRKAREELEPLKVRLIPVSYATADDIKPQVTALLSARGKVNIDERTNVLIVEDIDEHLVKIERLVRTLDTQTPQVLIESRIVEARDNFSRELGIQWGGTVNFSQQFGNQTGLDFPSNVVIQGGADDQQNNQTGGVAPNPQYAVNLPATVGSGGGGALGFILGSVDGSALINLRLSAAEAIGRIKLVSAPKIVTMDNKEARILSGEKVPITVITANGPTTRFINANLELGVTPHVTQDGAILMKIEAKKNEISDRVDLLGVPGILTNEANTEMIVQDGDTAVLGGLYRRNTQENESYVPWIGKVPVLGWLFKTTSREDARNELLIFISPRIVNRQSALVRAEGG
jgi:type IV pilus assembly protein PilQ